MVLTYFRNKKSNSKDKKHWCGFQKCAFFIYNKNITKFYRCVNCPTVQVVFANYIKQNVCLYWYVEAEVDWSEPCCAPLDSLTVSFAHSRRFGYTHTDVSRVSQSVTFLGGVYSEKGKIWTLLLGYFFHSPLFYIHFNELPMHLFILRRKVILNPIYL